MAILREENVCSSDRRDLNRIATLASCILRSGEVIVYPTETVYGLGCDYSSEEGYREILELKGLKREKPLILLIPDVEWLKILSPAAAGVSPVRVLVSMFWPGPLTLVLPAASHLPEHLVGSEEMVSMRMSSDPFVQALLGKYKRPITSTSANPTGKVPATGLSDLRAYFSSHRVPLRLVVDGGERSGPPSTLVKITGSGPVIERKGAIPASRIYEACRT